MKRQTAAIALLVASIVLANLLLLGILPPGIAGGAFAAVLLVLSVLSGGFRRT